MGLIAHGIHWFVPSPKQGAKAFVNPGLLHIDGLDANESKAILEFLYHHSTQPQFL